jgi:hypothetical protein
MLQGGETSVTGALISKEVMRTWWEGNHQHWNENELSVRSFYPIVNFPVNAPAQPQVHARIFQQTTKQGKSGVIDVSPFFFSAHT